MIGFFISWLIISNICHVIRRNMMNIDADFVNTFMCWNCVTFIILFFIYMYRPDSETLLYFINYIR